MKKFHLALNVLNIESSVREYSVRLLQEPDLVIPDEYALWRTDTLNISIRKIAGKANGTLRHLGWENPESEKFQAEQGGNGILWEEFSADQQAQEIEELWPGTGYRPKGQNG